MSSYIKATNFASKDALLEGNPLKVVSGTEIDDEFNAIQTAVNTKADKNSPVLTGTPLTPTPTAGATTTQIANAAFVTTALVNYQSVVDAALEAIYPIGSIYTNASDGTNPATLVGFGTWVAFGAGRVAVGLDAGDPSFDTIGETGGTKDIAGHTHTTGSHALTIAEMPSHNHSLIGDVRGWAGGGSGISASTTGASASIGYTGGGAAHNHGATDSGGAVTDGNLQPYITVYMWKRTA